MDAMVSFTGLVLKYQAPHQTVASSSASFGNIDIKTTLKSMFADSFIDIENERHT